MNEMHVIDMCDLAQSERSKYERHIRRVNRRARMHCRIVQPAWAMGKWLREVAMPVGVGLVVVFGSAWLWAIILGA